MTLETHETELERLYFNHWSKYESNKDTLIDQVKQKYADNASVFVPFSDQDVASFILWIGE